MKNITIGGNVGGKDAETRTTQSGKKVTNWSMAVNHYNGQDNETLWFDVSMWGNRGEAAAQFAKKGQRMVISGDLSTREHNGKTYLQVTASDFTPMSPKEQGGNQNAGNQSGGNYDAPQGGGYGAGGQPSNRDLDGDAIPFMAERRI